MKYKASKQGQGLWIVVAGVALLTARFYGDDAEENAKLFAKMKNIGVK